MTKKDQKIIAYSCSKQNLKTTMRPETQISRTADSQTICGTIPSEFQIQKSVQGTKCPRYEVVKAQTSKWPAADLTKLFLT